MCIYCGTNKYRKIYENHYGPIPKDETGRSYEIHHIDGNHSNNNPNNLTAVTIQEHYDIHYSQEDYGSCFKIAKRLKITPETLSELARLNALSRVSNGTHPFLDKEKQKIRARERVKSGVCVFTDSNWQKENQRKILERGAHAFQVEWTCEHCGVSGKNKGCYTRLHGDNCPVFTKKPRKHPANFSTKIRCEVCGKLSDPGNHKQHHGPNCKAHNHLR